jgi:hypothetical protein
MKPQVEGRVWQVLGLLVVIAAAIEIRSASQLFIWTSTQSKYEGYFAGCLSLAGATAMISGRLLRVTMAADKRGRPC